MQGLRQRGWAGLFRRHGALILILACWAAQALGYWMAHALPRADAVVGDPVESWETRLKRLERLRIDIQTRQRALEGGLQTSKAEVSCSIAKYSDWDAAKRVR